MNNKPRVGVKPNQILSSDIEVKIIGGKAVVTRIQKQGNQIVNKSQEHVPIETEEQQEVSKMASSAIEESQSEEVFSKYKCSSLPEDLDCIRHPGSIVEAGALAAQALPQSTYDLKASLPKEILKEGKLSDLQLEGILYACQRHQLILPDGKRSGFFLADGTGVGKGRQIAGIILDNVCRKRTKHIWFSISSDLKHDAERDLRDIGCYVKVIDGCQQLDQKTKTFGLSSEYKEGVVFSTYSTLVSSSQKDSKKTCRLDQLIEWCGKDFDGCLIFDESHKAKHFMPGKEKSSTKVAVAVTNIQRLLPKARVVYCSATGVTDVKNMAFMERLGLWGMGSTFTSFESFLDSLTKRGLGALEMLSMEMKASGMYVSRGLSYHDAEFQTVETSLTDEQIKVYNKAVDVWKELKRCLTVALGRTGSTNTRIWIQYWGCHQRFFKQLCMSMKIPEIARQSKEALENGYAVVIGLQTTGEASMDSELDQNEGNLSSFISLTREILRRFITQFFPTIVHVQGEEPRPDDWSVQAKTVLIGIVEKISLPNSPLDELIDQLGGPSCIAEMTGRKGFIGRHDRKCKPQYIARASTASGNGGANHAATESINVKERNAFMNGKKIVAIISDAASTGISLHADIRAGNKRRRMHITAELPWSADKAVQQLGRSHRSNQKSGPIYKLLTSNLGGERRFASAVARRLQSLGAITKGDRRAATGADLTQFNFDTNYGRQALKTMYEAIVKGEMCLRISMAKVLHSCTGGISGQLTTQNFHDVLKDCLVDMEILESKGVGFSVADRHAKDVGKFLNRILGLQVHKQNLIFSYFCQCLDATTELAKREGRYNDGVSDLKGNSIVIGEEPKIVFKETDLGASITRHVKLLVDRGYPFEKACNILKANEGSDQTESGFYRSRREQYGKKLYLLAIQKQRMQHLFTVTRPNTGMSQFEEDRNDLFSKYEKIEPEQAEEGWTEQYNNTKEHCIHGETCKHKGSCFIGSRISEVHLITGRILSILPALELTVNKFAYALQLPRELRNLRVVRVELDNGQRLVGLRYPHSLISEAEQYLTEQKRIGNAGTVFNPNASTEPITPVDKKARHKALSKPVTLHKFFGSTSKLKQNTCSNTKDDTSIPNSSNSTNCDSKLSESNKDSKSSHKQTPELNNNENTPISGETETNKTPSRAIKRALSSTQTPPNKRPRKQESIFTMMSNKNLSNSAQKKRKKNCPICQKDLEGLDNLKVNKHIDSCVIE
ncbi:uncharacterized protein [Clytia hemisphaerica]|uniref:Helicase ATP-binding domain-containing protein n=1 Tax=Clytia hemisphaerica TaxID=252671 RepID=A0A7M5XE02_9CNID